MTEPTVKKTNYLNNKDLLKEIHLSKNSYCSFLNPDTDHIYDIILDDKKDINDTTILQAKQNKAKRIEKETKTKVDPDSINETSLIFRIKTWDHIPKAPVKKKTKYKTKTNINDFIKDIHLNDESDESVLDVVDPATIPKAKIAYVKVNFPPFVHYQLTKKRNLKMIGKSHWEGDFKTGQFNKFHGQMTDNLARMIIKLCERYSNRSNWRSYTYQDEMRGQAILQLTAMMLQFDESKSDNPFSYATSAAHNSFLRILNIEKRGQNTRDDLLEQHGLTPSMSRQNQRHDE